MSAVKTTVRATFVDPVTQPGVYQLTDAAYHADPVPGGSLSVSGARKLLPPSCPAKFAYERDHPPRPKPEFDLGHAAHLEVLGVGADLVIIEAANYQTKAAREARDQAHADGRTPVLAHQHQQVRDMAAALRAHPIAGELLSPETMLAEQSVFWLDGPTFVWRRARLDAVSRPDPDEPPVAVDYKTCQSADLDHISRALHNYGYAMQARWYLDAVSVVDEWNPLVRGEERFLFVFQEVAPPYLVTVVEPDAAALEVGEQRNRRALEIYRDCAEADVWPAHTSDHEIPLVGLPPWVERQHTTATEWEGIL